jgi:hypothetical protein
MVSTGRTAATLSIIRLPMHSMPLGDAPDVYVTSDVGDTDVGAHNSDVRVAVLNDYEVIVAGGQDARAVR